MQDILGNAIRFFNSNFFIGSITAIVGSFALYVYFKQKSDNKRDAANIILLEIKSAERAIKRIKDRLTDTNHSIGLPADTVIMESESWSRYKYLFVREFDRDEWDAVAEFYSKCKLLDEVMEFDKRSFWNDVEQIRVNKQRVWADYAKREIEQPSSDMEGHEEVTPFRRFDELYMSKQAELSYKPQKTLNDAKLYIESLTERLSLTSVGTKLNVIANQK